MVADFAATLLAWCAVHIAPAALEFGDGPAEQEAEGITRRGEMQSSA